MRRGKRDYSQSRATSKGVAIGNGTQMCGDGAIVNANAEALVCRAALEGQGNAGINEYLIIQIIANNAWGRGE